MPKTLLAVDDSATMRKALEITFSGEDYRVIAADGPATAVAKLAEGPNVVVIDTALGGADGYALCKEVRSKLPKAAIILLSSRYNPYDSGKGQDAGADDFCDKPFDTQQLIDKAKKALGARESGATATGPYRAPAPAPAPAAPAPVAAPPQAPAAAPAQAPAATAAKPRAATLMFGASGAPVPGMPPRVGDAAANAAASIPGNATPAVGQPAARAASPAAAPPAPVAAASPPAHTAPAPQAAPAAPAAPAAVAHAVNGAMAAKLDDMGLTKDQAEAVLTLSREIIERVVWEVVPQLAETLIKEEIARLTRD